MDKWEEVAVSDEFEQCCQEVAAGEYVFPWLFGACVWLTASSLHRWGPEGGKTLTALFRRLRAPR